MVKYNNSRRVAYNYADVWFLIPVGKKRAPLLRHNWDYMLHGATDDRVKLLDENDRKALTDAGINGCLGLVLPTFWEYIDYHRRHIAKNIIVDEEWEDEPY